VSYAVKKITNEKCVANIFADHWPS